RGPDVRRLGSGKSIGWAGWIWRYGGRDYIREKSSGGPPRPMALPRAAPCTPETTAVAKTPSYAERHVARAQPLPVRGCRRVLRWRFRDRCLQRGQRSAWILRDSRGGRN